MRRRRVAEAPLPAPVVRDGIQQPQGAPASLATEGDGIGIGVALVLVPDDHSKCVVAVPGRDVPIQARSHHADDPTSSPTTSAVGQMY